MSSDDSPISSISDILNSEIKKLENQIDGVLQDFSKHDISQIIPIYHQVLNVSSMNSVLKQFFKYTEPDKESKNLLNDTEKLISEKFNSVLHPNFLVHLSNLISNLVSELKEQKNSQKTETEIKNDAAMYDKLRGLMSTKEFVTQYDQGLFHD
jgi:hypothetical protein